MDWLRKNEDVDNGKSAFRSDRGTGSHSSAQSGGGSVGNYPTLETGFGFNGEQQTKSKPNSMESLYPTVVDTNPDRDSVFSEPIKQSSLYPDIHSEQYHPTVSLYPTLHMSDLVENPTFFSSETQGKVAQGNKHEGYRLYPETSNEINMEECNVESHSPSAPHEATETILIRIPGALVHLIDKQDSMELASGDFILVRLVQGGNAVAVFARVGDDIQWPLAKDEAAVKLDACHYFFSLSVPNEAFEGDSSDEDNSNLATSSDIAENILNYGVTFAARGQAAALQELDKHLEKYSSFSHQKVSHISSGSLPGSSVLDDNLARETAPTELSSDEKKQLIEERSAAYWTTLAPNVEDYSSSAARAIAAGSGQLIKGILWCGDVTVEQLRWGNDFLKKRLQPNENPSEISPEAMRRMKRAKRVSRMSEKAALGILSGVVKLAGFITGPVVNSKAGKKFFSLLPGEVLLASLDAFGRVFDAVEVAGKSVLSTSSVVTTDLVSHKYGEQAGKITNEGFGAAGHMAGTAWTISKLRKALNPKNAVKATTLAKSAAKEAAKAAKKEGKSK
jgi:spartin